MFAGSGNVAVGGGDGEGEGEDDGDEDGAGGDELGGGDGVGDVDPFAVGRSDVIEFVPAATSDEDTGANEDVSSAMEFDGVNAA